MHSLHHLLLIAGPLMDPSGPNPLSQPQGQLQAQPLALPLNTLPSGPQQGHLQSQQAVGEGIAAEVSPLIQF